MLGSLVISHARYKAIHASVVPAVVFKMHYKELLEKQEEIQKLSAVIQVLSQK